MGGVLDSRPDQTSRRWRQFQSQTHNPARFNPARTANLTVPLNRMHVANVQQGARGVHAEMHSRAGGDFLNVKVSAPHPTPDIGDSLELRRDADEPDHRPDLQLAAFVPMDDTFFNVNDAMLRADAARIKPGRHRAVLTAKTREADGVQIYLANMHAQHHSWSGTLDPDAAAGRIATTQQFGQSHAVRMCLQPWSAIQLSLHLEYLARRYAHSDGVIGAGLKIERLGGGALHG